MGLIKALHLESENVRRSAKGKKKPRYAVGVAVTETKKTEQTLKVFPIHLREKVLKQGLRAAANIVRADARRRLKQHESSRTGTADKQSKKVKEQRSGRKYNLARSMWIVVKELQSGALIAMVGGRRPYGNHGHLVEGDVKINLWGSGRIYRRSGTPFLRPAADTTMSQQEKAMLNTIRREWEKI